MYKLMFDWLRLTMSWTETNQELAGFSGYFAMNRLKPLAFVAT